MFQERGQRLGVGHQVGRRSAATGPVDAAATLAILRRSSASPVPPGRSAPIMWVPPGTWVTSPDRVTTCTSWTGSVASWSVSLSSSVPSAQRRPAAPVVASTTAAVWEVSDDGRTWESCKLGSFVSDGITVRIGECALSVARS